LDGEQNEDNCNFLQSADSNNEVRDSYGDSPTLVVGARFMDIPIGT